MEVIISLTPTLILTFAIVFAYLLSVVLEIRKELRKLNDSISSKLEKIALNKESYDVDYNRDYLRRLAEEYGVPFDEEVFNDEI